MHQTLRLRGEDVADLPRHVSSLLGRLQGGASESGLAALLEHVVRALAVDRGFLFRLTKEDAAPRMLSRWTRPELADRSAAEVQLGPSILRRVLAGEVVAISRVPDDVPLDAMDEIDSLVAASVQAMLLVPVDADEGTVVLGLHHLRERMNWAPNVIEALRFTTEIIANALTTRELRDELNRAHGDLARLSQRLDSQVRVFKEDIQTVHDFEDIVGSSPLFAAALKAIREVAPTDTTTLLLGETGTGKELFARALHERSARRQRPFVCVNCAALPASLIESELFGHERGAFTGAISSRQGRFELADRGTIFLDEIGDLPLELQPKLLRVLQEREFERVGSAVRRRVDVRVVAATHHDLAGAVAAGRFRPDLYYRLSVFPVKLPPLRERLEDIPQLVWFLINQRQRRLHRRITDIPRATMEALQRYPWPGNVRELENVIERAMIRSTGNTLLVDESLGGEPAAVVTAATADRTLEALERSHIEATLRLCRGRINGAGNAAERLGLHPNTLRFRMKKLGIVRRGRDNASPLTSPPALQNAAC
jgi:transcriptional regulator with GAF, ATPase, and Fis domain